MQISGVGAGNAYFTQVQQAQRSTPAQPSIVQDRDHDHDVDGAGPDKDGRGQHIDTTA